MRLEYLHLYYPIIIVSEVVMILSYLIAKIVHVTKYSDDILISGLSFYSNSQQLLKLTRRCY